MAPGYQQIQWLTEEEVSVFDNFTKMMSFIGTFSRSSKQTRVFSFIFWSAVYIPMSIALLATVIHYIEDIDFLAYTVHHFLLLVVTLILTHVIVPAFCPQIYCVMDESKNTYDYESDLVDNYARKIIRKRLNLSRLMTKMIYFMGIGIILEVQLFFAIESYYLKTYKTVYPLYIGLDLDDWLVFISVILWQELTVYYTTYLPVILGVISYTAWSHLDLEMKMLTFAIANVQKIVQEKSGKRPREGGDDRPLSQIYESYCCHFAKHHSSIISYFNAYSQAISWITPLIFTTGLILFVTVGLSTMSDNVGIQLKLFWFLVTQMIVTYFWCLVGQHIGDKSEEISEVVVSAPWWLMPSTCHSTLLLIMTRCRKPLKMSTPFGSEVNVVSFMEMMKSVYQAISLVYQMKNE